MKTEVKIKLKQLTTGVHLVCISDAVLIKDADGNILETENEDEVGLTIRYSTGKNDHFDHDYWYGGPRQAPFDKMCVAVGIDPTDPNFRKQVRGKRLWICIKEIHDIDGENLVVDDITGPQIAYQLFDTIPCIDPNRKPVVRGNPHDNAGVASGVFLDYRQIGSRENHSIIDLNKMSTEKFYADLEADIKADPEKYKPVINGNVATFTAKPEVQKYEDPKPDEINWDEYT